MYCGKCGKQSTEGIRYCIHCGADMAQQTPFPPASASADETIDDTAASREEMLDASKGPPDSGKTPGGTPRPARMVPIDAVGVGKTLAGRYKITDRLGVGGMGEVFKALDTELNDLPVAIKILPPMLAANTRSVNRLRTEAAISLKLTHPNICRLHTFRVDGSVKFLVMDHIPGRTLEEMLDETDDRRLPLANILPIARNVAGALDFAHSQNPPILHRDVKPSNVMVTPGGMGKVLDFGIARELKDSMTRMTGKDTSGTLLYMSPEQFTGSTPSAASDIYSFAAMLYECLCGHAPFWQGSIAHQLLNQVPVRLPGMPDHVNDALQAGLAKNSADRPASARELVRTLEGRGAGDSAPADKAAPGKPAEPSAPGAPAAPVPNAEPAAKTKPPRDAKRSHPLRTFCVLLVVLAGVAGAGYWQGWWPEEILTRIGLTPLDKPADKGNRIGDGGNGTNDAMPKPIGVDAAVAARKKAESSSARVKGVAPENGFDLKLGAVDELLKTGANLITRKQYTEAVATFENVVARCMVIEQLDIDRQQAQAARIEVKTAREAAQAASAAELAAALWQGAQANDTAAQTSFDAGKFADAAGAWQEAKQDYDKAVTLAALGAKVTEARKEWDDALAAADEDSLNKYGGALWKRARDEIVLARAAGITEEAPAKWRTAAASLREAWKIAFDGQALGRKIARHITDAQGMIDAGKFSEARAEADKALALAPGHEAATFLAAKADAGGALALARTAAQTSSDKAMARIREVTPDLKRLAAEAPSDTQVKAWLAEAEGLVVQLANMYRFGKSLTGHTKAVVSLEVSLDGTEFITGSADGTVKIWSTVTGTVIRTIDAGGEVVSAVYSHDGRQLAWATGTKLAMTARAGTARAAVHEGHLLAILAVRFAPSGKTVVTCGEDDKLLVRDATSGEVITTLDNKDDVTCLAFSSDGKRAISGSGKLFAGAKDELVKIWDLAGKEPKCVLSLGGHTKTVRAVAFSSDDKFVASAGDDGVIVVRDAATGKEVHTLKGHDGAVSDLCFRKDGLRLASAGADKTIRMWDLASGKSVQTLKAHTAPVRAVRFTRDDQHVLSAGDDKSIIIWPLPAARDARAKTTPDR